MSLDRKDWGRIVQTATVRYRLHIAGQPHYDGDDAAWLPETITAVAALPVGKQIEEHIIQFAHCLEDVGREQLA